jgi:hypothetical protein
MNFAAFTKSSGGFSDLKKSVLRRQRRLFQIRRDSNDAAHERAHTGNRQGWSEARLQIEMRGINAYGGKACDHAIGGAGDCCSQKTFGPKFQVVHKN